MRKSIATFVLTTALWGGAPAATAQDEGKPDAVARAQAAEEAFLKAYFAEKELKDYAAAERAYATIVEKNPDAREVVARSLLGQARCLVRLKRDDEAAPLLARVAKEFADFKDVATEAQDARRTSASAVGDSLDARIRAVIESGDWRDEAWKYGERGVPAFVAMLRDESPENVYRAAETLARMDVPAAHQALVETIEGRQRTSTYPEQVRNAVESDYAGAGALRRIAELSDPALRTHALSQLIARFGDEKAIDVVVADPALRAVYFGSNASGANLGELLLAALARGGEARDAALARLRGEPIGVDAVTALADPPPSVLADADVLEALVPLFIARDGAIAIARMLSPGLIAAFLRQPRTAMYGIRLTLASGLPSADPAALAGAIARLGTGTPMSGAWTDELLCNAVLTALGPKPSPDALRALARSSWPLLRGVESGAGRIDTFVAKLLAAGVSDEASLLAFQEGLGLDDGRSQQQFVGAIRQARYRGTAPGAWTVKSFLRVLASNSDGDERGMAAGGLNEWQAAYGDATGLAAHVPELVAALGRGGSDQIVGVLRAFGPASIDALRAALPTHPQKATVLDALVALGDTSVAPEIERLLGSGEIPDEQDTLTLAAALVKLRGDAAEPALTAALSAAGGKWAKAVFEASSELSAGVQKRLVHVALAKAPGSMQSRFGSSSNFSPMTQTDRREIVRAALRSTSAEDRLWAAEQEAEVLDFDAWDALLDASQDSDYEIRDAARKAMRAIRDKENEIQEFRAMGQERATRKRIEELLGSPHEEKRRAGVAAIAATGLAGMVNELIRLAAEDPNGDVQADARAALLAMARSTAPVPASRPAEEPK